MIAFACDLRENGIPLIVGMYPCHGHWHINALDVTDIKNPKPLDVLLSTEKIDSESECCARLAVIIEQFDPEHEPVDTLIFQAYSLDTGETLIDRAPMIYIPPMPDTVLLN